MKNITIVFMMTFALNSFCSELSTPVWQNYSFKGIYPSQNQDDIRAKQEEILSKGTSSQCKTAITPLKDYAIQVSPITNASSNIRFIFNVRNKQTGNIEYTITSKANFNKFPCEEVEILALQKTANHRQVLRLSVKNQDILGALPAPTLSTRKTLTLSENEIDVEKKLQQMKDKVAVEKARQDLQQTLQKTTTPQQPSSFITTNRIIAFASLMVLAAAIVYHFEKIQAQFAHSMGRS